MRIVGAVLDWADGYANDPRLIVEIDGEVPARSELRFERLLLSARAGRLSREQSAITGVSEKPRTMEILYAEDSSGYVSFVEVGPDSSYPGMSGGDFTLTDGERVHVQSGWTISSTAIREHRDVIECVFRPARLAGFLLAERAREVVAEFLPDVEMFDDGSGWTFKWRDAPTKAEWQRAEHERIVAAGLSTSERSPYSLWPTRRYSDLGAKFDR